VRKIVANALALLVLAGLASAQVPNAGNVFLGYSFINASSSAFNLLSGRPNMQGWEGSLEGKILPGMGIVADLSGDYGSESYTIYPPSGPGPITVKTTGHQYDVLFGPRASVPLGKFRLFAQTLLGVTHMATNNNGTNTSWAVAPGGGIDYRIMRSLAWRVEVDGIFSRLFHSSQGDLHISTGVVIRF
jgi:hypothetical protein